jgi:hypothetical protein
VMVRQIMLPVLQANGRRPPSFLQGFNHSDVIKGHHCGAAWISAAV